MSRGIVSRMLAFWSAELPSNNWFSGRSAAQSGQNRDVMPLVPKVQNQATLVGSVIPKDLTLFAIYFCRLLSKGATLFLSPI